MLGYTLKRLGLVIPLLGFVLLSLFTLSQNFPYDPVVTSLQSQGVDVYDAQGLDSTLYQRELMRLGLDRPAFYLSVSAERFGPSQIALLPNLSWYGKENQFHSWVLRVLSLDFGISAKDGKSAWGKTASALGYTARYILPSLILTIVLSLLLGLYSGRFEDGKASRGIQGMMFVFSAVPMFWFATVMVVFFTTAQYGMNLFPRVDVFANASSMPWKQFILPVLVTVLHSMAYLTIQVKNLYLNLAKSPMVVSLSARGLSQAAIVRKHLLPNMLIPLVTLFTGAVPAALGGSVVIEEIFNIPGIGRLLLRSISEGDWVVVVPVVLVFGVLTALSYLLGDILYTSLDPRIKLSSK